MSKRWTFVPIIAIEDDSTTNVIETVWTVVCIFYPVISISIKYI